MVNHDGGVGTSIDPLVWSDGSAPKERRVSVRDRAFLLGPPDLWVGSWITVAHTPVSCRDIEVWPYSVGMLVKWVAFLHSLHWPVVDVHDAADVFLYRDSSIAPLLDMRRRFKAVIDVLDAMIRYGISLSRSVELTAQWDRILAVGPLYPVTHNDLGAVQGLGIGDFHRVVSGIHHRFSDFIHSVVVHRRDEAFRGGVIGCGRIPLFILTSGSRPI